MSDQWYASHTTLVSVADHAVEQGELTTADDVVRFVEKPWNYPELHAAWVESIEEARR